MENILEIKNLNKKYKSFELNDVNLTLPKGYIMGFIGENGSGKTTTIKLIMDLINRDSGEIKIFGMDNIKNSIKIKQRIGFVYDECFYYEGLTINKNAKIISNFYEKWSSHKFNYYLKIFKLDGKKKLKNLSKGMKLKFKIAIALSHEAELLIMDEPTAGLDPIVRDEILEIFRDIVLNDGVSIFFSTHITQDLQKVADYITYINDGKIEFSKPLIDVLEEFKIVKGDKNLINDVNLKQFESIIFNQYSFEALTDNEEKIKKVFGDKVIYTKATLEEIMVFKSKEKNM